MKIAGYVIDNMKDTAIVSTGSENGFPNCLMLSVVQHGQLVSQIVCARGDDKYGTDYQITSCAKHYPKCEWISKMSSAGINKHFSKSPMFKRNKKGDLVCLAD